MPLDQLYQMLIKDLDEALTAARESADSTPGVSLRENNIQIDADAYRGLYYAALAAKRYMKEGV